MHLMRIGPVGSEKPVARLTDETYVDLSETIHDFDETFFSSEDCGRFGHHCLHRLPVAPRRGSRENASAHLLRAHTRFFA